MNTSTALKTSPILKIVHFIINSNTQESGGLLLLTISDEYLKKYIFYFRLAFSRYLYNNCREFSFNKISSVYITHFVFTRR